jgi:hypothetical protein
MSKQTNKFSARLSPAQRNALKEVREEDLARINGGAANANACW